MVWQEGSENPEFQFQQHPCIMLGKNYYAYSHPLGRHGAKQVLQRPKHSSHGCNTLMVSKPTTLILQVPFIFDLNT